MMGETSYVMGSLCKRSKNSDSSGFGSVYCVAYRDLSKFLTWHVQIHSKFVADVVACKFGGLFEDKDPIPT